MTAAEFERLSTLEAECVLRHRLRLFVDAGAGLTGALFLAAQVEIPEQAAIDLLSRGLSADLTLRLLY